MVRLRADISDLRSQMRAGAKDIQGVADSASQVGKRAGASLSGIGKGLDAGLAKVSKHRDSLNTLGNGFGVLGLAAAAGVGVAVKSFADFDQAMSRVAASGQDARDNLDALRQAAVDAGAQTAFSASEAADGIENLAKAGVSAQDTLGGGLKGALDLAAAGGISVGEAAETAATALTQFGLAGADVPHIADLLAAGAGKAQGEVGDLAGALKQSGLVASQFGLSVDDTVGALSAFASAGLLGSDAGTSFKTMLLSLANPSKQSAETMERLGIAAYDAQGNFVGVAALAGQLQDKLGGLSQQQRSAALATIFGSDAIRAANVLYEQGAQGIQGWTDQVNDSGFAAATAATRMDNLTGDLEALRGSLESAFIGAAGGANAPLRELVQNATDAVNAFNGLSEEAQSTTFSVIASVAGFSLAAAAVTKLAIAAGDARAAVNALGISTKAAVVGIPLIGVAIAGIGAVVSHFAGQAIESAAATQDFVQALSDVEGVVTAQNAALNENVQLTAAKRLQDNGALDAAAKLGIGLDTLTDAALGNAQALAEVQAAVFAGRRGNSEMAQASAELGGQMFGVSEALEEARVKHNQLAEATRVSGAAAGDSQSQYAAADAALAAIAERSSQAATELDDLVKSLFASANAALALSGSQIGFEAAIDSATDAVRENGRTLNVNTEAGRANRTALNNLATASQEYISTLIKQGASSDEVERATKRARSAFIQSARAAGMSAKEARDLATSLGLVPKDTRAGVSAPGAKASKTEINEVKNAIKNLPKSTQTEILSEFRRGGIDAARAALRAIDGTKATTYVDTINRQFVQKFGPNAKRIAEASGGYITGPGTGTSDDIPAWLSNGEYVLRAAAVRKIGIAELDRLNAMGYAAGGPVGFAAGGRVDAARIMRLIAEALDLGGEVRAADLQLRRVSPGAARDERALEEAREAVRDARRSKNKKALAKAEDELEKAEDRHKKSADKAKEALSALRDAQQALADAARQTSEQLSTAYRSQSLDVTDILARMREGAVELSAFQRQLATLRRLGLSETLVRQISERGALAGGDIAQQIIDGGRKVATAMNKANSNLTKAADKLGYDVESRRSRHAMGGLITGPGTATSDSINARLSNGEYVVNAAATARNLRLLHSINHGTPKQLVPAYAAGGLVQSRREVRAGDVHATFIGQDADAMMRKLNAARRDAYTMALAVPA